MGDSIGVRIPEVHGNWARPRCIALVVGEVAPLSSVRAVLTASEVLRANHKPFRRSFRRPARARTMLTRVDDRHPAKVKGGIRPR